jgi:uncharacterized protein
MDGQTMTLRELVWGPPRYRASTPWGPLWAAGATVAIIVAAQAIAALAFAALPSLVRGDSSSALMSALVMTQAAAIGLVLAAARLFGGRPREVLRLDAAGVDLRTLGFAVLLMAALLVPFNGLVYLWRPSDMLDDLRVYAAYIQSDAWVLAALAIGVGAPLMEELLFRGFLQSALAQGRIGFWPAAVLTTIAWTLLHLGYSVVGLAEVFLIGMYFSWLLWKTGSLLPALFCHALYNTGLTLVLRFAPLPT